MNSNLQIRFDCAVEDIKMLSEAFGDNSPEVKAWAGHLLKGFNDQEIVQIVKTYGLFNPLLHVA